MHVYLDFKDLKKKVRSKDFHATKSNQEKMRYWKVERERERERFSSRLESWAMGSFGKWKRDVLFKLLKRIKNGSPIQNLSKLGQPVQLCSIFANTLLEKVLPTKET